MQYYVLRLNHVYPSIFSSLILILYNMSSYECIFPMDGHLKFFSPQDYIQ